MIPTYCEPKRRRRRQTINIDLGVVGTKRARRALLYLVCSHSIAHIIQLRFLHNTTTTSTSCCTADWLVGLTKFEMRHCENSLHAALELCRGCRTSAAAGLSLLLCVYAQRVLEHICRTISEFTYIKDHLIYKLW